MDKPAVRVSLSINGNAQYNIWSRIIDNPLTNPFEGPLLCRLMLLISVTPSAHSEYTSLTCRPSSCKRACKVIDQKKVKETFRYRCKLR